MPLYLGEFGPDAAAPGGWGLAPWQGPAFMEAVAAYDIPLSTMWAFECPSHGDMGGLCIHPGRVGANPATTYTLEIAQAVERDLAGLPPEDLNLTLYMLPPPAPGAGDDPAW